ncbi:MAG: oligosaccharide flippase family protein [Candidatus Nanohaloarchaea archaeon]
MADADESLKTLAKGTSILFIGTVLSKAMMYLYRILVARYLGPADYGLLNLGLAVFWISVTFSNLGIGGGIQRRVTHYLGRGEEEKIPAVLRSSLALSLPWSLVVSAAVFLGADMIAVHGFQDPATASLIRVFALAVPFQILYKNGANLVKAYRRMEYITYADKILRSLTTLLVTAALLYLGYGVMGAVIAQLAAVLLASVLILYFAEFRIHPFLRGKVPTSETSWLFHYSWPLFLSGIIGLAMSWTDTVLLGFFDTTSSVGVYNAAYPTAQLLFVIPNNLSTVLFPSVSEMYSREEKDKALSIASTGLKWIFAAVFPGLILMAVFGAPLLRLLFGSSYVAGSAALAFLGTAYFIRGMTAHAGSFIKSEEWTRLATLNSLGAAALNIVLNVVLIPRYSTAGAGLATAISLTLVSVAAVLEVRYLFDVNPYRFRSYVPPFAATIVSAAITYSVLHAVFDTVPPLALIPAFMVFAALYAALFIAFGGIGDEDLEVLRALDERTDADLEPLKKVFRKLRNLF